MEETLKYELRCGMEALDKISEDLEGAARQHNSKIMYGHVNKLRGNSQLGLVPVKDRNEAILMIRKEKTEMSRTF